MEQSLQALSVPIITVIVYWIITIIKISVNNNEKFCRFIPLLACVLGVTLAIVAYFTVPEVLPTKNLVVAIVLGGASGLSATGTNQIFKQLGKVRQG
jgi:RsiW-degrading membrane proteinase PrsW (M82 family)